MTLIQYLGQMAKWTVILWLLGFLMLICVFAKIHPAQKLVFTLFGIVFITASLITLCKLSGILLHLVNLRTLYISSFDLLLPVSEQIKIPAPLSQNIALVVFFKNASPDMVSGEIFLRHEGGAVGEAIKLSEPKPFDAFLYKNKKQWPRATGRQYYPLVVKIIGKRVLSEDTIIDLKLTWNFEGEYLESLKPKSGVLQMEIWLIGKKYQEAPNPSKIPT